MRRLWPPILLFCGELLGPCPLVLLLIRREETDHRFRGIFVGLSVELESIELVLRGSGYWDRRFVLQWLRLGFCGFSSLETPILAELSSSLLLHTRLGSTVSQSEEDLTYSCISRMVLIGEGFGELRHPLTHCLCGLWWSKIE